MGVVLSRLWPTKRSFREHLEFLESEIKRIETAQQRNAIIKRQVGELRVCVKFAIKSSVHCDLVIYIPVSVQYYTGLVL